MSWFVWMIVGICILCYLLMTLVSFTPSLEIPDEEGMAVLICQMKQHGENCWLAEYRQNEQIFTAIVFCKAQYKVGDKIKIGQKTTEYVPLPKFYEV